MIGRGITATPRPTSLPSSILPSPSTQRAFIPSRRKSARVSNNVIFFSEVLLVLICVKLCKLKLRYSCGADKSLARPGMKQAAPVKSALGRGMDCDLARVRTGGVLLRMWQ